MKHTRRRGQLLGVACSLVLVAAACGGDHDATSGTEAPGAAAPTSAAPATSAAAEPQAVPGFDGTTIKLGVLTPLSGPVAILGKPLAAGNQLFWDYVNDELGGIAGKYKVELVQADSKYDPTTTAQQYNAVKNDVVMFQQVAGTPMVAALLEQLGIDGMVAVPASADALWVHQPNLAPLGAPYQIQTINGVAWYLTEGGGKGQTVCFAGHSDAAGDTAREGLEWVTRQLGVEIATEARFAASDTEFSAPVQQLQSAGCQVVALFGTPTTAAGVMGTAAQLGFAPKWIGNSPTFISALLKSPVLRYLQANFYLAAEGTAWGDESVPGMAQLVKHIAKYKPDQQPDQAFATGYVEAWAAYQILQAAVAAGDLGHEGIVSAMNGIDELDFGGLSGTYTYGPPENRDPPRTSTIFQVDPAVPGGLKTVASDYQADAATSYQFKSS
jgi:ABC-type branched-subunit amino acid transport system substrate-binding protein